MILFLQGGLKKDMKRHKRQNRLYISFLFYFHLVVLDVRCKKAMFSLSLSTSSRSS